MVLSIGYNASVPEALEWQVSNGLTYPVLSDLHGDVTLSYTNYIGLPLLPWDAVVSVDRILAYTDQTYVGGNWNIAEIIAVFDSLFDPQAAANPTEIDFGTVVIGMSAEQTLVLDNAATGLLEIQDIISSSPDISADPTQGQIFAVDDSLVVTVTFAPWQAQTYNDTLTIVSADGNLVIPVTGIGQPDAVATDPDTPQPFAFSCYPNPFNTELTIRISLKFPQDISVALYNVQGSKRQGIWNGELSAGLHDLRWADESTPSGLYIIEVCGENWSQTRKVALMR